MQHATLGIERWSAFTLDQQILMMGNEMLRASKLLERLGPGDAERLKNGYERVLNLADLTISANTKPTLRRELLRWRDLVAALYVSPTPSREEHQDVFRCLLRFTPEASKQIPYVLDPPRER